MTVAASLLLALAPLPGGEREAPKKPAPTSERVRLAAAGAEWSGWVLAPEAAGGYALLGDDGRVALIPRTPAPKVLEIAARPVLEIPTPPLVAALAHADASVRERCEELLLDQGEPALPHVGAALADASADARRAALDVLSAQAAKFPKGTRAWLARVGGCLDDGNERVRQSALRAYAHLGPPDVLERCRAALRMDASPLVKHEAIVCLGRCGDKHAIDPLLDHLHGCDEPSLRKVTFDALRRLAGRNLGRDEEAWRAWWTNHRAEVLGEDDEE